MKIKLQFTSWVWYISFQSCDLNTGCDLVWESRGTLAIPLAVCVILGDQEGYLGAILKNPESP